MLNQDLKQKTKVSIDLSEEEYFSVYEAIKTQSMIEDENTRNLNVVLLKMMKAKHPEYFKSIGPWDNVPED